MKLKAKARLSGPFGVVDRDDEFTTDAKSGADLVERGLANEVAVAQTVKADKSTVEKT